jgi:hypothetical protein
LLLADIDQFIGNGLVGFLPGTASGIPDFAFPSPCNASVSLDRTHIELASECTLPSGRHTRGTLAIALGSSCGLGGLTVEFDLLVESQVGANDELAVNGKVDLKIAPGELWLASRLEHESHFDHDVASKVAGCFNLNLPARRAAFDGVVSLDVDGQRIALFRAADLQQMLCEWLPYNGAVHVEHDGKIVEVAFDRDSARTGIVTVTVDGAMTELELPVPTGGLCSGGAAPQPATIDYQACGGCGNPVPPTDPQDPVPEPPVQ